MDLSQLSDADLDAQIAANAPKQNYPDLSAMSDADLDAAIMANTPKPPGLVDRANAWMYNNLPASFNNVASSLVDPYTYVNAAKDVVGGTKKLIGDASGTAMEFMQNPIATINNVGNAFSYPITNAVTSGINKLTGSNLAQLPAQGGTSAAGLGDDIRNILPYVAGTGLATKGAELALPAVNSMWRDILARTLSTGAVSGAQGQNPVEGAAANLFGEGIGRAANIIASPIKSGANMVANKAMSESQALTPSGAPLNPEVRSPAQAQALLSTLPENFKTSLGQVTNSPWAKDAESIANGVPLSSGTSQSKYGVADTNAMASSILSDLAGGIKPEDLNQKVLDDISAKEQATKTQMNNEYTAFEKPLTDSGFMITQRPNVQAVANSYLNGNDAEINKGISLKKVSLSPEEQLDLQNISNPKDPNATYAQMRGLESQLKDRARDEYSGIDPDINKAKMWDNLADAVRKDYEVNAVSSGIPGVQKSIEDLNNKWKNKYYDIYKTPQAYKLIKGNPNNVYGGITARNNQRLLDTLDQNTKHNIYLMGLKNSLKTDVDQNPVVDSNALVNRFSKGNANEAEIQDNLLSPEMKQKMQTLKNMSSLTQDARESLKSESPGKAALKGIGALGAAKFLGKAALPILGLPLMSNMVTKRFTNPNAISRYSQGKLPYDINQYPSKIIRAAIPVGINTQN
ncbi:hypothetical protein UFOVP733_51 [uncultured Caudovirales phage]|uniref:Uncharacterized protein n=1 Tax=uncultured Caudovirales phage TaxID=2100421 RepID=A0A6J7X249_9CAUD|nr:hypothetical protein UFOVP733_51 [uncultured Caudovirales phage]CAB5224800.1 hypothetical protein UFOVP743_8 [uncultured Caudovirales phage]